MGSPPVAGGVSGLGLKLVFVLSAVLPVVPPQGSGHLTLVSSGGKLQEEP